MKLKTLLKSKILLPNYKLMPTSSPKTKLKLSLLYQKITLDKMLMPKPLNGMKTPPITTEKNSKWKEWELVPNPEMLDKDYLMPLTD